MLVINHQRDPANNPFSEYELSCCCFKVMWSVSSYIVQYPVRTFTLSSLADGFNQTTSLGSIQPYATIIMWRLLIHISTTVYTQVLINTAEWTGAMSSGKKLPTVLTQRHWFLTQVLLVESLKLYPWVTGLYDDIIDTDDIMYRQCNITMQVHTNWCFSDARFHIRVPHTHTRLYRKI